MSHQLEARIVIRLPDGLTPEQLRATAFDVVEMLREVAHDIGTKVTIEGVMVRKAPEETTP